MFKSYGTLGVLIIIFAEIIMFLRVQPFIIWFTPLVWVGYILIVDAIVYMLKGNSLLMNRKLKFIQLACLSVIFWYIFEIFNQTIGFKGWIYVNLPESTLTTFLMGSLSFATIIPAIFETSELVRQFHLFNKVKLKVKIPTNKLLLNTIVFVGIIFLVMPFLIVTHWVWVFVWTGFILLLEPILYFYHDEKSLIMQIKKRKFNTIISLFVAGYICGFLWEFWNYWAYTKWYYVIPLLENIKIFEIPAIGFLAYGPFALELYVMYSFVKLLLSKRIFNPIHKN